MAIQILIIIIGFLIFLLAAIPLNITVKLVGGETHLLKTAGISFLVGLLVAAIQVSLHSTLGSVIAFIVMLWVYKAAFAIGWLRAFLVWLLHGVVTIALTFLVIAILAGVGILAL